MRAKLQDMVSISLQSIDPTVGLPFPLFLHLPRNQKFIPIRHAGDPIGAEKYTHLMAKAHFSLWTRHEFKEFIEEVPLSPQARAAASRSAATAAATDEVARKQPAAGALGADDAKDPQATASGARKSPASTASPEDLADLPALVQDVLEDDLLDAKDKAEILSDVSQDALRVINQITAKGEKAREEGFRRSKDVVDKILLVAAQHSDVYSEVLKIWESQEAIFHTAGVGTLSVMFAMCLGHGSEAMLADMVVAAVFHDVGKVAFAEASAKPVSKRSREEAEQFEQHVEKGVEMIKESGLDFHPRVYRMIGQHHEKYDGSGYPNGLKGMEIDELSQLLALANYFDGLISGMETGEEIPPALAFKKIYDEETALDGPRRIAPELTQRLFQFLRQENEASHELMEQSRVLAEDVGTATRIMAGPENRSGN